MNNDAHAHSLARGLSPSPFLSLSNVTHGPAMFSESFLARGEPNSQPLEQNRSLKSPLNSFEDWKLLEGVTEWPSPAPDESSASNFDADTVLGPLDDIRRDLETHSRQLRSK